jgi:CheY-like chemotaxis protein
LSLARPLAEKHGVRLESCLPVVVPSVSVHPVMLNQMLLNLLSVAIHQTTEGTVSVTVQAIGPSASVQLGGDKPLVGTLASSESDEANLEMARKLASLCRGALEVLAEADGFTVVLHLPAVQQIPVLFIDDTEDVLQLVERYLAGTRFRAIGARDPRNAFRLVEEHDPEIIVLDVMMPQIDGWHTLGLLRQHPLTSHIPVVVYTILAQGDLALSLGASAFVQKTASRQTLVRTLETVVSKKQTRSH